MKNNYLLVIILFISHLLTAQQTYVPDDNFEQFLIDVGVDDVLDNYVLTENISAVKKININNKEIRDLTGIEDFTALEILYCSSNQISNIDVSKNESLIKLSCSSNQIRTLNVSANIALTELYCDSNVNLENLDVSTNQSLTILSCSYNMNLSSLDASSCYNLKKLYCHSNNNLSNLNVSGNSTLEELYCHSNNLTILDISSCPALNVLHCYWNNIATLDLSNCKTLITLFCSSNNLTSLDLSFNSDLKILDCSVNNLSSLNLIANSNLEKLACVSNNLSNLDIGSNTFLIELYCNNNGLNSLNIKNGNNTNLNAFNATSNLNLECIEVDDGSYMDTNWSSGKDATASFSENCENLGVVNLTENSFLIHPNPVNDVLNIELNNGLELKQVNIYNIQGQYLFSSRTKKVNTKSLKSGVYFMDVETSKGKSAKKIVVE
ncbi:T9SS type A sorting domain-containing protein [Flavobacteriaceae bacterium GSB9]|nr:T9SS type A sorting domain-containing protein [Flavobacteriaceae bacterium GSB9]